MYNSDDFAFEMELTRTIYHKMCIIQKTPEDQKVMKGALEDQKVVRGALAV